MGPVGALLLLACRNPEKPETEESRAQESEPGPVDSELPTKEEWTCDREEAGFPWEERGFWEEEGPFAALLLPTELPTTPHWELRMARKTGERSWEADPRVLAVHVSSFGILPAEDGLLLSVSIDALPAEAMGLQVPITRELVVFATKDLQNWSSHLYRLMVEEEVLPTDQSLWVDAEGALHAVYYRFLRVEGQNNGIPSGPHPIATAIWKGGCFEEEAVVYTADNLLDPVICPYPEGQGWWLFATTAELQVEAATGESPDNFSYSFLWDRASVPFCRAEEGMLALYGQRPDGLLPVTRTLLRPDGNQVDPTPIYDVETAPFPNCTTPVLMEKDGTDLLFCAVWVQ